MCYRWWWWCYNPTNSVIFMYTIDIYDICALLSVTSHTQPTLGPVLGELYFTIYIKQNKNKSFTCIIHKHLRFIISHLNLSFHLSSNLNLNNNIKKASHWDLMTIANYCRWTVWTGSLITFMASWHKFVHSSLIF